MKFPKRLQSRWCYKFIDHIDYLWVFQRTTKEKIKFDSYNHVDIKQIADPQANLLHFSINLLGVFHNVDKCISLTKEGLQCFDVKWEPEKVCCPPKFHKHFNFDNDKDAWYIMTKEIFESNYKIIFRDIEYVFRPQIKHDPTLWNFWHFVIEWDTTDKDNLPSSSSGKDSLKRALTSQVRIAFQEKAFVTDIVSKSIDRKVFEINTSLPYFLNKKFWKLQVLKKINCIFEI